MCVEAMNRNVYIIDRGWGRRYEGGERKEGERSVEVHWPRATLMYVMDITPTERNGSRRGIE